MQYATSRHNPLVGGVLKLFDVQSQVFLQLFLQTVVDVARGHELTLLAEEWRVVDLEEHRHRGLVDSNRWQRFWILDITEGVAYLKLLQSDDGTDVTTVYAVGTLMAHTVEGMQFLDLRLLHRTVAVGNGHLLAVLQLATMYASYGDTACIARIVERGDEHLRGTLNLLRSGNHLNDLVQQIGNIGGGLIVVLTHPTVLG